MNPTTLYLSITLTLLWYPMGPVPLSAGSEAGVSALGQKKKEKQKKMSMLAGIGSNGLKCFKPENSRRHILGVTQLQPKFDRTMKRS